MEESLSDANSAARVKKPRTRSLVGKKTEVGDLYSNMYWARSKTQHLHLQEKVDLSGVGISETNASDAIYGANLTLSE